MATGRGRRPDIPQGSVTNKLLLQLYVIKKNNNCTWQQLESLMTKLSIPLPSSRYRTIVESAVNACQKLAPDDRLAFLAQTLDLGDAGSNLSKVGIQRHHLLDEEQLKAEINSQSKKIVVTNGMIVDLHLFRKKEQLNWSSGATPASI